MEDKSFYTLALEEIAERCRQEDARFHNDQKSDARYCYELFRRAFLESSQIAWNFVYEQYYSQMIRWIRSKKGIATCGEEPDYFVNRGFEKFWVQVGKKTFIEAFPHLGGILAYLRMCLVGEYIDYLRKNKMPKSDMVEVTLTESIEMVSASPFSVEGTLIEKESSETFMQWITAQLTDEREEAVLEGAFNYGLSAKEILSLYPSLFTEIKQIYRVKDNIMRRIRRKVQKS